MTEVANRVVDVVGLMAHPQNYNEHSPGQVADLRESLRRFGQVRSIVVQATADVDRYLIVAGHGVVEAARAEKMTRLRADVIPAAWDEVQVLAYLAADNELARAGAPDDAQLAALVERVRREADESLARLAVGSEARLAELRALTVAEDAPDDPGAQVDRAEELREKWGVEAGQLWGLGEHRVICGDCTDADVVARVMGGERAEMLFSSPPYADAREYGGNDVSVDTLKAFIPTCAPYCSFQVVNLGLIFRESEVVQYWDAYIQAANAAGLKFLAWNVWDKTQAGTIAQATNMFYLTHEWIFVFGEDSKRLNRTIPNDTKKYADRYGDNFLDGGMLKSVRQKDGTMKKTTSAGYTHHQLNSVLSQLPEKARNLTDFHPAVMRAEVAEAYMEAMTDNFQIVLDPFLGSGTTLIACERLGRRCRGVEISPKYVAVTLERWAEMTGETPELIADA